MLHSTIHQPNTLQFQGNRVVESWDPTKNCTNSSKFLLELIELSQPHLLHEGILSINIQCFSGLNNGFINSNSICAIIIKTTCIAATLVLGP